MSHKSPSGTVPPLSAGAGAREGWVLDMNDLGRNFAPGLSSPKGSAMAEAGGVCLELQGHTPGASLQVTGDIHTSHGLRWPTITDQSHRTWSDLQEATEEGAAGIAILLAKQETGYSVSRRSRKGTGVDYWLGGEPDVLRDSARLEVSGILRGDEREINARAREKMQQASRSDNSGLPVYVGVVEFSTPAARLVEKKP